MKRFWSMAIALAALPLSPAVAKPSDWLPWNWGDGGEAGQAETMSAPELPGFVVGYEIAGADQSIREEVPKGETVEKWTRMVTMQRFRNLAQRVSPAQYTGQILKDLPKAYPKATASSVQLLKVSGFDAARIKVVCPKTANGQAESFFLLAVAGNRDMHVKQVAFRGEAKSEDFLWARKFLSAVVMCKPGSKHRACY